MSDLRGDLEHAVMGREGALVEGGKEINFLCPAHPDSHGSGNAQYNRRSGAWHCKRCGVGGGPEDLAQKMGIRIERPADRAQRASIAATYDYHDAAGNVVYQVVRLVPKDFRQRRPDGKGGWVWDLKGITRVLYRLPGLLAADALTTVYVCEGEKDADALVKRSLVATTNPQGASETGRSKWYPEWYNPPLRGRHVVILPDNDVAGTNHALYVASGLIGTAASVRVLRLPGLDEKGDVSDWLAKGGSAEDLDALAAECPEWEAPAAGVKEETDAQRITGFPLTDTGNAELFAHLFGDRVRHDWQRGRWLIWHGQRWGNDRDGQLYRWAKDQARERFRAAEEIDDTDRRKKVVLYAIACESSARIESAIKLARSEPPIADNGAGWDANPFALGCENGTLNLVTGELAPGRIDERITMTCGLTYNPDAPCPRWLRFLDEVFAGYDEVISFIQRAVGYSVTGSTREQVLFLCHGKGSNGKSVFLNVLRALVGEYGENTAAETLEKKYGMTTIPADVAMLAGKRLVTCSETAETAALNEARVKALTGGDTITARFMRENFFSFTPVMKLWLATNHLPRVDDDSEGFWRRVRIIPFERQFQGADRDPDLERELRAELPGILAWAAEGARQWAQEGLAAPPKVMLATLNYRQASDPLAEFMTDYCIYGEARKVTRADLYKAYVAYCDREVIPLKERIGIRSMGRRVGEKYPNYASDGTRYYRGIALRAEGEIGQASLTALDENPVTPLSVTNPLLAVSDPGFSPRQDMPSPRDTENVSLASLAPLSRKAPDPCGSWCDDNHDDPECGCEQTEYWPGVDGQAHCEICHPPGRGEWAITEEGAP